MPKINMVFDTATKESMVTCDGMPLQNMKNCAMYYDDYQEKYCFEMYLDQSIGDEMSVTQIIRADLNKGISVEKQIENFLSKKLK